MVCCSVAGFLKCLLQKIAQFFWFNFVRILFKCINYCRAKRVVPRLTNELLLQSATSLSKKIREGKISSLDLVESLIGRIEAVNPSLNLVVIKNYEQTRNMARECDRRVASGNVPPANKAPFFGVPFTLKDCIFVEGLRCTAGIFCRQHEAPQEKDAEVVANLRLAGAIGPIAVTNVSEVCMWWEANNTIYGRSKNPYDGRRIVGGSSGGEGGLISAGGSIIGIGSDIGGSIRMPCFFNGIFGHKPTKYIVSDEGCYPKCVGYQSAMHSAGPMCRYAEDLGPMLTALGGVVASTQLTLNEEVPLGKLRIFYMEGINVGPVTPLDADMKETMIKAVKYFRTRYDSSCIRVDLSLAHRIVPIWMNDMSMDKSPSMATLMTDLRGKVNPYPELMKYLTGSSHHTLPALLLCVLEQLDSLSGMNNPQTRQKLVQMRECLLKEMVNLLGDNGVFLFPSHPTPPPFHYQPVLQPYNFMYTAMFNSLALPATQVPMGLNSSGIPVGLQVTRLVLSYKTCGRLPGSDAPAARKSPKLFVWLDKSGSSC